jgi:hypothetical protein
MKILLPILLVFICHIANALTDTVNVYRIENLVYHSDLEKSAFGCYQTDQDCDLMSMALATDSSVTSELAERYITHFYNFLNELKGDKKFAKKPAKQIKFIFKAIHDEYFRLYRDNPTFIEIFTAGYFNCITASVLYGLAFEYYGIPYEIFLSPTHVYLMAYPEKGGFIVETTNPMKGAQLNVSYRDKSNAVQNLINMKLVLKEEVNQKGLETVFNDHYLAQEKPDLTQLVGSLYFNKALEESLKFRLHNSYELFKKSSFLHPRLITTGHLILHAERIVSQSEYTKADTYRVLTEMEKFIVFSYPRQQLIDQSISFLNDAMRVNKYSLVDSAYVWLYNGFTDEYIKNELKFAYHYNKSLDLFVDLKREESFKHAEVAYSVKPDDNNVNLLLLDLLWGILQGTSSAEEANNIINSFAQKYAKISNNNRFQILQQLGLLSVINYHYINLNFDEAEKYRAQFEEIFTPDKVTLMENLRFLEQTYSTASLIYFRSNKISKSRAVLVSGLKYLPDSYDLKIKMRAL